MKHGFVAILILAALGVGAVAAAQPAPPGGAAPGPVAPAPGGAAAPGAAPAPTGFELRDAPQGRLRSGRDALRPEPGGLTADAVAARAVEESPEVRVAAARVHAAAVQVDKTVVMFLPQLKVSAQYRRVSETELSFGDGALVGAAHAGPITVADCPIPELEGQQCAVDAAGIPIGASPLDIKYVRNHYVFNASIGLPISDYVLRLSNAVKGARDYEEAARIAQRAVGLATAANARIAYYNWLRAVAGVAVAETSLARVQALLTDTKTAFELGVATRADVMRLEATVASVEQMVTEARGGRRLAGEQLAVMMDEPQTEYRIGEDVLTPTLPPLPAGDPETLVAEAQRQRLEVQSLRTSIRAMERGVKAARIGQYPRLDGFGDFTYSRPNQNYMFDQEAWHSSWALGLSLSYTLNGPLDSRATMALLAAQKAELEANLTSLERGVHLEVSAALTAAQNARTAVASAQHGAEAAEEGYRVSRELYRAGRATTTDVMSAEAELVAASLREVNTLLDVRAADVKLAHALGRDAPGGRR